MRKMAVLMLTAALLVTGMMLAYDGAEAGSAQGAPGTPVGVGGIGYIDVTWAAAPGSPSQYYVYWSTVNGTVQISGYPTTVGGTTSHVTVGGSPDNPSPLPAGYTLYFQICADYGGTYSYSGWSAPITTTAYPGVPTGLQAAVSEGNIALSWSAPADDGGASIANYTIYRGTVSGNLVQIDSVPGSSLAYLDDSAAGGQTYLYAVAAHNGYSGALTDEVSISVPAGRPGIAENLQCTAGSDNITLTWSAPAMDGGSAITDYRIYRSIVSGEEVLIGSTGGANLSYVDRGVAIGETYYYQVAAVNSLGESGRSSEVSLTYVAPPSAPQNVQAAGASGQIRLTWEAPVSDGGSPIIWYDIYRNNLTAADGWTYYSYTEGVLYFNDTDVQEGCTYQYKVVAWNEGYAEGPSSDLVEIEYALPSEPLNINAVMDGKGSLLVSWTGSDAIGITGYAVYWGTSPGTYAGSAALGNVTSYLIIGLADDTTYYVTVAAVNGIGTGPVGTEASASTASAPGAVVSIDKYNNGPGHLNIFWDAPGDDGGLAITKYTIYRGLSADDLAFLADIPASRTYYFDSGLMDGVTYYYKVTATNAVGEGAAATISGKCGYPPSVPQGLTAVGGRNNITLTWQQPSYTGGGITGYILCRCATMDGQYTTLIELDGNVTRYVDAVGQNETWFYKVFAAGAMGTSSFSNMASTSSFGPPAAPAIVSAEPGDGKVRLVWEAPAFEGSPSITGYIIYRGTSPSEMSILYDAGLSLEYNDTGLVNGNVYYYAVLAYSSEFTGPLSDPMAGSAGTSPSMPHLSPLRSGDSYALLQWTPSTNNGGREITAYELYRLEGEVPDWSTMIRLISTTTVFQYNDTSVVNGHTYTYYIIAVNELGSSGYDALLNCIPCHAPEAPSDLVAEGGSERIYLNWTAPGDLGGGVLHYLIYRGTSSGDLTLIDTIDNVTSYIDLDVIVGTRYYYCVAASNWAGAGITCPEVANSTIYRPGAPMGVVANVDGEKVHLTWEAPAADGNAPIGYRLYRSTSGGTGTLIAELGPVLLYDDADVMSGVAYHYRVAAFNGLYESALSAEVTATPSTVPDAPTGLEAISGIGYVSLTWASPGDDGGAEMTGYNVYRGTTADAMTWLAVVFSPAFNDTEAVSGTSYLYRIAAVNANGESAPIEIAATALFPPPAPTGLTVERSGTGAVITWDMPDLNSTTATVTGFAIYRQSAGGDLVLIAVVNGSDVRSFTDAEVPEGTALYSVATLNGYITAGATSISQSAELTAENTYEGTVLIVAIAVIAGFMVLFLLSFRRKNE